MGKCGFRANPDRRGVFSNTKMYFQTAGMYFQTLPIVISHTRLAPGAYYRRVYCPESRKREEEDKKKVCDVFGMGFGESLWER